MFSVRQFRIVQVQILPILLSVSLFGAKPMAAEAADSWVDVPAHDPDVVLPASPGPVGPTQTRAEEDVVPEERDAIVGIEANGDGCTLLGVMPSRLALVGRTLTTMGWNWLPGFR